MNQQQSTEEFVPKMRAVFSAIRTAYSKSTTSPTDKRARLDSPPPIIDFDRIQNGLDPWPTNIPTGFQVLPKRLDPTAQLNLAAQCVNVYSKAQYNNFVASEIPSPTTAEELLEDIRWTTLGYNYDWTNRTYRRGWITTPIDDLLFTQSCTLAKECGHDSFIPEAVIVNFYHPSQRMGPHRDDAELTMSQPIISISLGLDAIFCIETNPPPLERPWPTTYESDVFACWVRSGDVMIMGGPSRNALHGCAFVKPNSYIAPTPTNKDDVAVVEFLKKRRLNLNIRQVEGINLDEKFPSN